MIPSKSDFKRACEATKAEFKPWKQSTYITDSVRDSDFNGGVCKALSVLYLHRNMLNEEMTLLGAADLKEAVKKSSSFADFFKKKKPALDNLGLVPDPRLSEPAIQTTHGIIKDQYDLKSFTHAVRMKQVVERVKTLQQFEHDREGDIKVAKKLSTQLSIEEIIILRCAWLGSARKMMEEQFGRIFATYEVPCHSLPIRLNSGKDLEVLGDIMRTASRMGSAPSYFLISIPGHALAAVIRPGSRKCKFFDPNHGQAVLNGAGSRELMAFIQNYLAGYSFNFLCYAPGADKEEIKRDLFDNQLGLREKSDMFQKQWDTIQDIYNTMHSLVGVA